MIIEIKNYLNHIEEGEYTGIILSQTEGADGKYLWLNIKVDDLNCVLNVSMNVNSKSLNDLCREIAKDSEEFDTADLVDKAVKFTVCDKIYDQNTIYSKIKAIKLYDLFTDEEVVFEWLSVKH